MTQTIARVEGLDGTATGDQRIHWLENAISGEVWTYPAIVVAVAFIWATYITLLGYFGGSAFEDSLWKPIIAALSSPRPSPAGRSCCVERGFPSV